LGLKNSVFKTPSGLNTEPQQGAGNDTNYNSKTTPYDLIRMLIAVRNTPAVYSSMSTRSFNYFLNGKRESTFNIMLGSSAWTSWEEKTGFKILAGKGGSLGGT
jgi:D-alanyl-D-alanine carboxypeptidase